MSQEKKDTGNLTGDNRKENEGRKGRGWRVMVPVALVGIMIGLGMLLWVQAAGNRAEEPKKEIPPTQTKLPSFPSDSFDPQAQATPGAAGGPAPIPREIQAMINKLEEDRSKLEQDKEQFASNQNTGNTGNQGGTPQRPRIRVNSQVTIARPPDSGTGPGGVQNASANGGAGSGGEGGDSRKGSVFSQNRLENNFDCQASAGQIVTLKLPEGFNTEQEGEVTATVTTDNWSRSRNCLTIPQGSWFHGRYKSEVARGQQRVSLTFTSIERPPPPGKTVGDTIMLDGAKAYERDGRAGLTGEVNSNIPWGLIIASTVIDLGTSALSSAGNDNGTDINIGGTIANNTGSVLRDVARDRYEKAPASIDVEPKAILVRLNQHLKMTPFPRS